MQVHSRSNDGVIMRPETSAMTSERLQEVRQLFESALDREPDERFEWLEEACQTDPQLYFEVEALLKAHQLSQQGLTLAPVLSALADGEPALPRFEGRRVGQYDIVREIAWGGMGVVYLARRADKLFSKH